MGTPHKEILERLSSLNIEICVLTLGDNSFTCDKNRTMQIKNER